MPGDKVSQDDRATALRANVTAYDDFDETQYINGAPHLKHDSIARIYRSIVAAALQTIGRDPQTIAVLELGAGNGLASRAWFEHKVKLTAVDSSESMLRGLGARAEVLGVKPKLVVADAIGYLQSTKEKFDIVTHVSMIHHVPDYLDLLARSEACVAANGCLITFQDPLRYDRMPLHHRVLERGSYFVWRAGQGNLKRGLKTRWRRLRGVYSPLEVVDFEDYHVVRGGVDSAQIVSLMRESFAEVKTIRYWSTYSRALQSLGERLHLESSFGILASGRKPT